MGRSRTFASRRDLLRTVVETVFGWGSLNRKEWNRFEKYAAGLHALPSWYPYLRADRSAARIRMDPMERDRAVAVLKRYFQESVVWAGADLNQAFFRGFEQGGTDLLRDLLPRFKRRAGLRSWSEVIAALASLFQPEHLQPRYQPKKSGSTRRSSFRNVRQLEVGSAFIRALRKYPPGGRAGWQVVWHVIRACAALKDCGCDFERALTETGVLEFLRTAHSVDAASTIQAWETRRNRFSGFVARLSGVGWNAFDYILRDLPYPGSLLLFKLDSTNSLFMEKVFGPTNQDRGKYLDLIAETGILDYYPIAVVNMAIYAFSSLNCLGYMKRLNKAHGGFELV